MPFARSILSLQPAEKSLYRGIARLTWRLLAIMMNWLSTLAIERIDAKEATQTHAGAQSASAP